jgi:hypothetical protein
LFVFLFALASLWAAGCNRAPTLPKAVNEKKGQKKDSDPFRPFLDSCRYSETTRAGEEWTRFRGGLDQLNVYFAKPEILQRMRDQPAEARKFLDNDVHLTKDELAEVESVSFRTADAHYLDECFLLRDAARSLNIGASGTVQQAHHLFRWVMRNVLPHEQTDSWTPPAFTLRRGYGSPLERSLVFLALLRQAQIEGCLIVAPDSESKPRSQTPELERAFLVAVLDSTGKSPTLRLFDPRLGLALWSKDGTNFLSLKEALDEPDLLKPSLISPEQTKKMEAWLVCPLYALSPRLLELQRGLSNRDTVVLHLNPLELSKGINKATELKVAVWNPPSEKDKTPNSPTRCLRLFLPQKEGGIDETGRAARFARARAPMENVLLNYAEIKFTQELLPKAAFELMKAVSMDLLNKYDLQTREMYLRGMYDSVSRRNERLQLFAKDDLLIGLVQDQKFRKELVDWQIKMRQASADAMDTDPQIRARGQDAVKVLWSRDQFIEWLINLQKEEGLERKHEKTVLTRVLAVGLRDHFDFELAHSQASTNHEKAVYAQAMLQKNPAERAKKDARDAWSIAKSSWSSFYLDRIALESTLTQRLERLQRVPVFNFDQLDKRISLLESLHRDVHKYFQAKLRLAECLEHLDGAKRAKDERERIKSEIESMAAKGLLQAEIKKLGEIVPQLPSQVQTLFQNRLDLLARDWSEGGNYFWLKKQIECTTGAPAKAGPL